MKQYEQIGNLANLAVILALIIACVGVAVAYVQLASGQAIAPGQPAASPSATAADADAQQAATLLALRQQRRQAFATLDAMQRSSNVLPGFEVYGMATQTAQATERVNVRATADTLSAQLRELAATQFAEPSSYQMIWLDGLANSPRTQLQSPISGEYIFAGIPFNIQPGPWSVIQTQDLDHADLWTAPMIDLTIRNVSAVYVLVGGGRVSPSQMGRSVGTITLRFEGGQTWKSDLIVGKTFRGTWEYDRDRLPMTPDLNWQNVFAERQLRSDGPATGYIDMLRIPVPPGLLMLQTIEFADLSSQNLQNLDPSLVIMGVTVATRN